MFININFFIFEGSYEQVGMNTKKNTKYTDGRDIIITIRKWLNETVFFLSFTFDYVFQLMVEVA